MAFLSASRRYLLRHLSTTTTATPQPLSVAAAKSLLRSEFDPDRAVSILSSISPTSPTSARFALDLTIRRLARSRRFADVDSLIQSRIQSHQPHDEAYLSNLILCYGTGRMPQHAIQLFDRLPQLLGSPHTVLSFNAVLTSCLRAKHPRLVPYLFSELSQKYSITPDKISYAILLKSLFLSKNSKKALETLKEMESKNIELTTVTYTTVIDSLYKEGKPEEAEKLLSEMVDRGCEPDLPMYNVKVMYHALDGKPEGVIKLMDEMGRAGLKPDAITYNYLITCYCNHGMYEEAKGVYSGFKEKKLAPSAATYKYLLGYLCRNGDFNEGLKVFEDSVDGNKIPDFRTTRLLVEGLMKESKVEDARRVIAEVKKKFPEELLSGWRKLEKELGLDVVGDVSERGEVASG